MITVAPNIKVYDQARIIKEAESLLTPRALAELWIYFCNNTNKLGTGRMQGAHLAIPSCKLMASYALLFIV